MSVQVKIKRLAHSAGLELPEYKTEFSAGMDLSAAIEKEIIISPLERVSVPTGLAISLPRGYEAQIRPRSGLSFKNGITLVNSPGTIDEDYRGEIHILLINLGEQNFILNRGERIAQMVIAPYVQANFIENKKLAATKRSKGGFGSTGTQRKDISPELFASDSPKNEM